MSELHVALRETHFQITYDNLVWTVTYPDLSPVTGWQPHRPNAISRTTIAIWSQSHRRTFARITSSARIYTFKQTHHRYRSPLSQQPYRKSLSLASTWSTESEERARTWSRIFTRMLSRLSQRRHDRKVINYFPSNFDNQQPRNVYTEKCIWMYKFSAWSTAQVCVVASPSSDVGDSRVRAVFGYKNNTLSALPTNYFWSK